MTWGSNASYDHMPCRYCGEDSIDDRDEGDNSHELECPQRHRTRNRLLVLIMWLSIFGMIFGLVRGCDVAHALDHGWDKNSPVAKWVDHLKRPDGRPGTQPYSCCGKGDMYQADIYSHNGEDWEAVITDGGRIEFPDGSVRTAVPNGTVLKFKSDKVNPPADGNPTGHAQIFLSVPSMIDEGGYDVTPPAGLNPGGITVWCFVPLPDGA